MEFITIKKDQNLKTVCDFLEQDPDVFIENTLNYLGQNEWIFDASEEWGKIMVEVISDFVDVPDIVAVQILRANSVFVVDAFLNLKIVGFGDCPECGGDFYWYGDDGIQCTNCDYQTFEKSNIYEKFEDE